MPYTLHGQQAAIREEPRVKDNRLYVPLGDLVERLGGQVSWDNTTKTATAKIGQWVATIRMGDRNIDVSGKPITIAADPYVEQDLMYVPVTFFRDAYGYNVEADPNTRQVSISVPR